MRVEISGEDLTVWKETRWIWATMFILAGLLLIAFYDSLRQLVIVWGSREEYSYGYLIPFITLFLIWQRRPRLEQVPFTGSWLGVVVVILGLCLLVVGNLSALFLVAQYAFLVVLAGLVLAFTGRKAFRILAAPLALLVFMIPLPQFFLQEISNQLQLISSQLGVWVIRLFNISVFIEGNVIDLGVYKLQVVEACSGLRYLFPLMTLGFIVAYFYRAAFWKRAIVFLSTIPITVLMNSFRIGMIGIMVEYWGKSMAEGFLHDFEGWIIFMACTGVLVVEIALLTRIGGDHRPLRDVFSIDLPEPTSANARVMPRVFPVTLIVGVVVILLGAVTSIALPPRIEALQQRKDFAEFPMDLDGWHGRRETLEQIYLDQIKLDDYLLADFASSNGAAVNFYVAYYASQRKGQSAHSPRTCIPGGGWRIINIAPYKVDGIMVGNVPLVVNRLIIEMGDNKQLVYYWFQQRGRIITNEYIVKWYIFWDSLTRNRSDGALVRLTIPVPPGGKIEEADKQLADFARLTVGALKGYIPN